jgi:acetyl-CoA carboxylase carboxyltransferase component
VFVDTPGYLPGSREEGRGVIHWGARLVRAFARATVPRVTVILRKAYGGAFIAMNSKDLGADVVYAWPTAEVGVMGAEQAVALTRRRELARATDPDAAAAALVTAYQEQHATAEAAARTGVVDEVIAPGETRERLMWAFALADRRRGA